MNFNSLPYLFFLCALLLACRLLPLRARNLLLLLASYGFYMLWEPAFALLLAAETLISYFCARSMERGHKKRWLFVGLGALLGTLVFFKYTGFVAGLLSDGLALLGLPRLALPQILLPVGISFFTFTLSGYLIDVYREELPSERNFLRFALFGAFFPQLLSGPIVRAGKMLPQYARQTRFTGEDLRSGCTLFIWGLFKKLVIADNAAIAVNTFYADPSAFTSLQAVEAAVLYALQIYCDFSSYSDMAIGTGRMLGFDLGQNFRRPYLAVSIQDFWRRWHISLSSWFRDYLYFPLGGSRKGKYRTWFNLLVVFAVSGLWHGAAISFLVWGLLNGVYQIIGSLTKPLRERLWANLKIAPGLRRCLAVVCTFALCCAAWVFFRADSVTQALQIFRQIFGLHGGLHPSLLGLELHQALVLCVSLLGLAVAEILDEKTRWLEKINRTLWPRYGFYLVLAVFILLFGAYGPGYDPQEFVYFRF